MGGPDDPTAFENDNSPMQRRRKGPRYRPNTPESGVFVRPTLVGGDGFLPYHLALEPILAAKVIIVRTVVAQLGKKRPQFC